LGLHLGDLDALRAAESAISAYKYDRKLGWSWIFGRILAGYLERSEDIFSGYDLIMPMPTFIGPGGRSWDHIGTIIDRAELEAPRWPFRQDVISKTVATPKMVGMTFRQRADMAETVLRQALRVDLPHIVAGKDVLVFDDVFTAGLTLREVALKLRAAGASSVAGIVLARQPY
jgi:predicted amidophosphoribosyltransferase